MRRLALLALATLAAFPLSAHSPWHRRPRWVVVERDACRDTYRRWDGDRWERRDRDDGCYPGAYSGYVRSYRDDDCGEGRVVLRPLPRPLAPPFQARVELWLR
ncbi:hypothetical protein [Geothrix edaphica]|uniref:DUF2510 domain-containing protein n=1 Tax=Geothrix edaphica TaxID=2927976 RepID=A0ABQ5Q0B5_9BACT|nr:hypothetical protein [Geothrix edaphica]GLH67736.1 hypothetical protein GETHED_21000 [Geothrix edaphica]